MPALTYEEKAKRAAAKVPRKTQVAFLESLRQGGKTWKDCLKGAGISELAGLGILENRPRMLSPRERAIKAAKGLPKETRQAVLDLIFEGVKFGEVASKLGITLDEVCGVYAMNLKKVPILNRVAV